MSEKIINIEKDDKEELDVSPVEEECRKKYIYTYLTSPQNEDQSNRVLLRDIFLSLS